MLQPVSSPQLCWFGCAPLAQLQSVFKCSLSTQMCTTSSSAICQLWQHMSAQLRCRLSAWAATLAIVHSLSAMLQPVTSPTNCQLNFTTSTQVQCVSQCISSAPLYSVSSRWSLLALLQSVCSAAICQLSSLSSFNSIVS